MQIEFTKSQIENLIEFFELNFIPFVRSDIDIDNMDYIISMADIVKKLKASLKEVES